MRILVGLLLAIVGFAISGHPIPAQASPTLIVQPIDVCNTGGTSCALQCTAGDQTCGDIGSFCQSVPADCGGLKGTYPAGSIKDWAYNPATVQKIYAQAGINIQFLAPVTYDNSSFLNPAVIDDPGDGYTTGNPVDPAHLLLEQPGHGQSTTQNVLNAFFVDSLPHFTFNSATKTTTAANELFGLGLLNSNGLVVSTEENPATGDVAWIDNLAHEIGHNLDLTHVEDAPLGTEYINPAASAGQPGYTPGPKSPTANTAVNSPNDLMRSAGRNVPNSPCDIAGAGCAGDTNDWDRLLPFQQGVIQAQAQHLFTVNLAAATYSSTPGFVCAGSGGPWGLTFPAAATNQALTGIDIRYASAATIAAQIGKPNCESGVSDPQWDDGSVDSSAGGATLCSASQISYTPHLLDSNGNITAALGTITSASGNAAGSYMRITAITPPAGHPITGGLEVHVSFGSGCFVNNAFTGFLQEVNGNPLPLSIQFDFSDGTTSRADFDASSMSASSTDPVALGNTQGPPGGYPPVIPTNPAEFNAISEPEAGPGRTGIPRVTPVPEPSSLMLLAGLSPLLLVRRRRRRC